jgi:rhodanese-related sulfurtransferase
VHWIDPKGLVAWQADTKRVQPVLLDARTVDEYAVSHLHGALRMDPYRPLLRPLRGMPKDTAIVVYSTVGYRGARLVHWLTAQGYNNATALSGSIFAWANEGRPLEREGRPVTEVHPYDDSWKYLLSSDYRIDVPAVEKKSAAP